MVEQLSEVFTRRVQDALAHLYDPVYLQTHPLVEALGVLSGDRGGAGRAQPPSAGHALRRRLLDAIARLRPDAKAGESGRAHRLLELRYVEALDSPAVMARLGIEKSQYYRERARAVTALISVLCERPEQEPAPGDPVGAGEGAATLEPVPDLAGDHGLPGPPPTRSRTNLPAELTVFVGREQELAVLRGAVQRRPGARLLTLTGSGGVGKTRLARRLAMACLPDFAGGVWLVELAALADPALVPQAVATVLGVREERGRPLLATLTDALGPKRLLLLLDNCEHLVDACARMTDSLLTTCPQLTVLATSREPLGIAGETSWSVPSLALPDTHRAHSVEALTRVEAVALFLDRAQATRPSFRVTEQNAPAVAEICRRLDGIPLALELAAARVRVLPPEHLLARLDDRFGLLMGGSRTAPARHQTLRAAIDWSYALLTRREQILFTRLSVFADGCTLEAAEAVCAVPDPGSPASVPGATAGRRQRSAVDRPLRLEGVFDLLARLVDKSVVVVEQPDGTTRYRLLETLRQYAGEHLVAAGEAAAIAARHAAYFSDLAERAAPRRGKASVETAVGFDRLEREHDNLRAALSWVEEGGDATWCLSLATALAPFWRTRGHFVEGRRWLEAALARGSQAPAPIRALASHRAGSLAAIQGDVATARRFFEQGQALFEALGAAPEATAVLLNLGWLARGEGDFARARALFEEALGRFRAMGDAPGVAGALNSLGWLAERQGELTRAETLLEESLDLARRAGLPGIAGPALQNLGKVALARGDAARAATLYAASLRVKHELGHREQVASVLGWIGELASTLGQPERAGWLLGAQEALREAMHAPVTPTDRTAGDGVVAKVRTQLDAQHFATAWAAGRALSQEAAVTLALATADAVGATGTGTSTGSAVGTAAGVPTASSRTELPPTGPRLSVREREVVALVADGRTNREIARALGISERTTENHVRHILAKLTMRSRIHIVEWAAAGGLVDSCPSLQQFRTSADDPVSSGRCTSASRDPEHALDTRGTHGTYART